MASPSELLRRVDAVGTPILNGADYVTVFPHQAVVSAGTAAVFSPHTGPITQLGDMAYAIYNFNLGPTVPSEALMLYWAEPPAGSDLWVAFSDWTNDTWRWMAAVSPGRANLPAKVTCVDASGNILVVVAVCGSAEVELSQLILVAPGPQDWSMFGHDAQRTRLSPYTGPISPDLSWSFTTGDEVQSSPAIGSDGTIYVGSYDSQIYALNPDGSRKWSYTTGNAIYSSPAIGAYGDVYVGSLDDCLYAFKPDGALEWAFHSQGDIWSSPAIAPDGTIYIGSYDGNLYALGRDGTVKWSFTTDSEIYASPALAPDGTVYIGSFDQNLYALYPDGTLKWTCAVGSAIWSSPAIGRDGVIYLATEAKKVLAISPAGAKLWEYTTGSWLYGSPAVSADGTVYIGCRDEKLYALAPNGTPRWIYASGGRIQSSPALGADGMVYFGSDQLYALTPQGELAWSYATGDEILSSPAIGADGTLYFGCHNQLVYALGPGIPVLAPPADFSATQGTEEDQVELSWSHPATTIQPDGYKIYRAEMSGAYALLATVGYTQAYVDQPPVLAKRYRYRATAYRVNFNDSAPCPSVMGYCGAAVLPSDWWMYGRTARHDRQSPFYGPSTPSSALTRWAYFTGGPILSSPAIGADGTVYIGSCDHLMHAVSPDGSPKWTFATQDQIISSPALGSDTVYFGSDDGRLYAVDFTGMLRWSYQTGAAVRSSPAIGVDGTVFVGSLDGTLYALQPSGELKWSYTTGGAIHSSPALDSDGTVCFGSADRRCYAVSPTGSLEWSCELEGEIQVSPAIDSQDNVYIAVEGGDSYKISSTGEILFSFEKMEASPAIASDDSIFYSCASSIVARSNDGTLRWRNQVYTPIVTSPAIDADGTVYFGDMNETLRAVSINGIELWRYSTADNIQSSVAIGVDGSLYFGNDAGILYAVGSGLPQVPPPISFQASDREFADSILLNWEHHPSEIIPEGYKIFRADQFGAYKQIATVGYVDSYMDYPPRIDICYSYYATGYNHSYEDSNPSPSDEGSCQLTFAPGDWYTYSRDPQHGGQSSKVGPANPTFKWIRDIGNIGANSPVVGSDGTIYITPTGKICAINEDGTTRFILPISSTMTTPTISNNNSLYYTNDKSLLALDEFGKENVITTLLTTVISEPIVGPDNTIYLCGYGNELLAVNSDNSMKWSTLLDDSHVLVPCVDVDNSVYVATETVQELSKFDQNGYKLWTISLQNGTGITQPAIGPNHVIYIGNGDYICAFNSDGEELWSYQAEDSINSRFAIASNGDVYAKCSDNQLYAISAEGEFKWSYLFVMYLLSNPIADSNGNVYMSQSNSMIALDSNGTLLWVYVVDANIGSTPAIGQDGSLIFGAGTKLYALGPGGS